MRVLLVDNDQDFVTLAATLLEAESEWIETVTETSPQAVFEHVDLATVDCIVSDYRMPEMDGIEFLKAVRESHPWLPFILFTQKGSEAVVEAAMDAGVSDYIVKNGSATQYAISANRIENLVRQYRTRRRANQSQALDALRRSTLQTALTEPTRAAIEAGVCEQLVASEYASVAWIGERDPHTGAIQPRVWAGDDDLRDSVSVSVPAAVSSDHEPAQSVEARALTTGRQQTESNLTADAAATKWETDAATHGFRAACAVPISYEGIPYGVLGVYSRRRTGFSADQEQLLKTVADVTGFAIAASDRRLGDTSRQVIDIEFDVSDTCLPFVDIASGLRVRHEPPARPDDLPERWDNTHAIPDERLAAVGRRNRVGGRRRVGRAVRADGVESRVGNCPVGFVVGRADRSLWGEHRRRNRRRPDCEPSY